jgi:hypothetical protein
VIRALLVLLVFGGVALVLWWDRIDRLAKKDVFFKIYTLASLRSENKEEIWNTQIPLFDLLEELKNLDPTKVRTILSSLEKARYAELKEGKVSITQEGVAYLKYKYLRG